MAAPDQLLFLIATRAGASPAPTVAQMDIGAGCIKKKMCSNGKPNKDKTGLTLCGSWADAPETTAGIKF